MALCYVFSSFYKITALGPLKRCPNRLYRISKSCRSSKRTISLFFNNEKGSQTFWNHTCTNARTEKLIDSLTNYPCCKTIPCNDWVTRWIFSFKAYKIKSVLSGHGQMFIFVACLVQEKNIYKVSVNALKTLTNSKNSFGSRIKHNFCIGLPLCNFRFSPVSTPHGMQ